LTQETKGCAVQTRLQASDHQHVALNVNWSIAPVVNRREQKIPIMKRNHPPMATSDLVLKKDWGNIANGSQSHLNNVALVELDAMEHISVRPNP
jgi:hypothetical protein